MHPWHNVGFVQRKARWSDFRAWLSANPDKRIPYGAKRADGLVFCGYGVGYANGEHWAPVELLTRNRARCSANIKRRSKTDDGFKEKYNAYVRMRYATDPAFRAKSNERSKRHRLTKPEMNRAVSRKRYALKKNLMHPQHDKSKELALLAEATRLTRETGVDHQVDHIIPLGAGGWHHHENMQVLPMRVNTSKNDSAFWLSPNAEWRDWRSVPSWLWPDHLVCAYLERLYQEAILAA